jgi:hypothetical protein
MALQTGDYWKGLLEMIESAVMRSIGQEVAVAEDSLGTHEKGNVRRWKLVPEVWRRADRKDPVCAVVNWSM